MASSRQSSQGQSPDNQATKKRKKQTKLAVHILTSQTVPVQQILDNVTDMENKQSLFIRRKNLTYPNQKRVEEREHNGHTLRNIEFIYIHGETVSHFVHGYRKRDNTLRV